MKLIWVLVDGLGDSSIDELGFKTPLEYANTPNMDKIASITPLKLGNGINGLMDPVEPGLACGSDTAHLSLFGYNPKIYYRGRGAFEAMGAGISMKKGDIAFKSNFAFCRNGIVEKRRASRKFDKEGPILCEYLNGLVLDEFPEYKVTVKYATEHRCGISVSGPNLVDEISGTDPLKDNLPLLECKALTPQAEHTARLVNSLSMKIQNMLKDHPINVQKKKDGKTPANIVLLRGCGSRIDCPTFEEMHKLKCFMIAPTCIISGIGQTIGMDIYTSDLATGDYNTDLLAKSKLAMKKIKDYDLGFIHIKAVDDAGHDKSLEKKIHFIERIDEMIGTLEGVLICITADHSTPLYHGDHTCEPVPFTLGPLPCSDKVTQFSEVHCAAGSLGRFKGQSLMLILKKALEASKWNLEKSKDL